MRAPGHGTRATVACCSVTCPTVRYRLCYLRSSRGRNPQKNSIWTFCSKFDRNSMLTLYSKLNRVLSISTLCSEFKRVLSILALRDKLKRNSQSILTLYSELNRALSILTLCCEFKRNSQKYAVH